MQRKDNYEQWRQDWRARFLSQDKAALQRNLPWLSLRDETLVVRYFIWDVAIDLRTGEMTAPISLALYDEMNIFTRLWYSKPGAVAAGEMVPFAQLRHASPMPRPSSEATWRRWQRPFPAVPLRWSGDLWPWAGGSSPAGTWPTKWMPSRIFPWRCASGTATRSSRPGQFAL